MYMKKSSRKKKKVRYENRQHLEYVATLPCMISRAGFITHSGPIQVHHLLKPSDGKRGWGLRAGDDQVVPLCAHHHAELHTKIGNEFKFFEKYGMKADAGQQYAKELFEGTNSQDDEYFDDNLPF